MRDSAKTYNSLAPSESESVFSNAK
jgi:hypothetical protein